MTIQHDYSLKRHNTFGIDVKCRAWAEYESEAELTDLLPRLSGNTLHIGGGSNLLFTTDFDGTVLHSAIRTVRIVRHEADCVFVRVGAGVVWDDFCAWTVGCGFRGAEKLSLIPGEVGAAAVQNIGAYGTEAKDIIHTVEAIHLHTAAPRTFTNADCQYDYRHSIFKTDLRGQYAVTHVTFRLNTTQPLLPDGEQRPACGLGSPLAERIATIATRRAKLPDPAVLGNAGSFFINPIVDHATLARIRERHPDAPAYPAHGCVKIPAGWMIEQCGWRGKKLGPAAVYERQALVLVNLGGATAADILRLSEAVRDDVAREFGVKLVPEVNII